ncbi:MAG: hypothetical protein LBV59_11815 [Sphingobacterium sp.]|jgi:hypothetical protein|uniref:hypothetical protein n=1 Tax=Sphingobacterium sp. TaxID=341027 RepID=UPI002844CA75|nr:hypothetical protein [Sphingobacterium sp.]MDR3008615.1 hypothetical protein [Sphingobacterium sp.]
MKRIVLSTAALMLTTAFSFAGTPETKAKPETSTSATIYHYASESTATGAFANTSNWQPGPSDDPTCGFAQTKPCEMTVNDAADLASKLSGKTNAQVLLITDDNRD